MVRYVSATACPPSEEKLVDTGLGWPWAGVWSMQARRGVATGRWPATRYLPGIGGCRRGLLAGLLCSAATLTDAAAPQIPVNLTAPQLRVRIDDASAAAAKPLSQGARAGRERSLARFYEATAGLCGVAGDKTCLQNEYYNYLAHIPDSVYRVDGHVVYETGVYGLLWADDSLQQQDPERPFTWDLRVTWPRVDEPADRSNPMSGPVGYALAEEAHARMSGWVNAGWTLALDVRLEGLGSCYISARMTSLAYGGGAHPYELFEVFNWLRSANRRLTHADLFHDGSNWQRGILSLYRQHLGASADGLSDDDLAPWVDHGYLVTSSGITLISHEGLSRAAAGLPDVVLTWADLRPWLSASVPCTEPSRAGGS